MTGVDINLSAPRGADSVLWLAVAGGIILAAMDSNYQWISWSLSGAILAIVGWVQVVSPIFRRWRMRTPFSAYFRSPKQEDSKDKPREAALPANSNAHLQVNRLIRITHRETLLVVGFEGDPDKRPLVVSLENKFIAKGRARTGDPSTNENHYVNDKDRYCVKGEEFRVKGSTATIGLVVKTRAPGRYEMFIRTNTDTGEGKPLKPLTVTVT